MKCIRCESQRVVKAGFKKLVKGKVEKYKTGKESYQRKNK